ncbi:MAG: Fe-S cluster assembly protein HesB [Acidobacteriota bacterium]
MTRPFYIDYPKNYSFLHTAKSHGWYDLLPFQFDETAMQLTHVLTIDSVAVRVTLTDEKTRVKVELDRMAHHAEIERSVRHVLRMDDDLEQFYALASAEDGLSWVVANNGGRLLRSPTVWEDLIKTICTTNCSWSLTRSMVANLVQKLGSVSSSSDRAFPTAAAMAAVDQAFYRDEIRAGYRGPYLLELARAVADGTINPESWLSAELPTPELKKQMKAVKGVGDYAAENLLKLVGRYDGLALDSWLRAGYYKRHNSGTVCPDKAIEQHYEKFGEWRGLAIWCDMTERWFEAA